MMKLKFGKVGLLFLALVISLAGIGGAFAAWTTEVKFEGQVNTGYLTFEIEKYSGTEAWKVNDHEIEVLTGWLDADGNLGQPKGTPVDMGSNPNPVGKAFAREGGANEADVVFEYVNLFPCVEWCADFLLHYTGTVPVIVTADIDTQDDWLKWLWDNGYVEVKVYESNEAGDSFGLIDLFDGFWQMHYCDYVVVKVCIKIPQTHPDGAFNNFQGQTGSFSGRIHAIQWNKYTNGNGNGIDWAITTAIGYEPEATKETAWALCCAVGETCEDCGGTVGWGQWFKYTVGQPQTTYPLVAGQDTTVGELKIETNGDIIIEFITDVPGLEPWWEIALSHLYVGKENGYPGAPGNYPYSSEKNPEAVVSEYYHRYEIPKSAIGVTTGDEIYIMAAHAEVVLEGDYFAFEFEEPGTTAVLELLCTGFAYNWLVEFTVKNTGEQAIKITDATVNTTGSVTAVFDPTPPPIIDQVLAVGEETKVSVRVNVPACDDVGDLAGTVTLEVFAAAA